MMKPQRFLARAAAVVVALGFGAIGSYGILLAAFSIDVGAIDRERSGDKPVEEMGFWRRPKDVKPVLSPWSEYPGMGASARRIIALEPDKPQNLTLRMAEVSRAIVSDPANGWLWLEYSFLCQRIEFCASRREAARNMVVLTSRREGAIMFREAFGLLDAWDTLSDTWRQRVVSNFVLSVPPLGPEGFQKMKDVLVARWPDGPGPVETAILEQTHQHVWWVKRLKR